MSISAKRALICLCVILALTVPILIRLTMAAFPNIPEEVRSTYQDEEGKYYLTDPDSYYFERNVRQHLETGQFGESTKEDGTLRDSLRFYPEGSRVNNTPGIVYLTEAVWKPLNAIFGTNLYDVEYCLAAVMAAIAGLAAFLLVRRMSGNLGGVIGGILVSCAPAFVQRTTFSRFDTDMFVVLMDILLILFLTEALRAKPRGRKIGYSIGFVITAWIYSKCWTAEVVTVITGFTLFGGFIYWIWNLIERIKGDKKIPQAQSEQDRSELWIIAGCGVAVLAGLLILHGTGIIQSIFSYIPLTADKITESGILPNSLMLVSELTIADWFPKSFGQWFWDPAPGGNISVSTGVGGVMVMLAALAGLIWLAKQSLKRLRREEERGLSIQECRVYLCILVVALLSWIFLIRYGMRFLEHLAVPVGVLAGAAIGWIGQQIREKSGKIQWVRAGMCTVLAAVTVVPATANAVGNISRISPSVTRVSDDAMEWIKENAEDPEAVIASWWDYGYYYEAESGHPCLWDGGSMDSVRAILFSKALTAHNLELSRRILLMLSGSGNRVAEYLMERVDAETAFDTIWEALLLEKEEAEKLLISRCGMTAEEAETAEALLHPKESKETYLLVTDKMMMQIGWFEYYAEWDFSGNNMIPLVTNPGYTPDGYTYDSPEGREYIRYFRGRETVWRLYVNEEEDKRFIRVFAGEDAAERLWMWRVN